MFATATTTARNIDDIGDFVSDFARANALPSIFAGAFKNTFDSSFGEKPFRAKSGFDDDEGSEWSDDEEQWEDDEFDESGFEQYDDDDYQNPDSEYEE